MLKEELGLGGKLNNLIFYFIFYYLMNDKPITAILIGAGWRGRVTYGSYALKFPDNLKFIAVAEPDSKKRDLFQKEHNIPNSFVFKSWQEILDPSVGKIAETAFICTQDQMHYQPAIKALELEYDLLLEKPISPSFEECNHISNLAQEKKRIVQVCHVLRFTKFFKKLKELIDSGAIGDIIDYDHSENVSYWHFGHSYVRGSYKKKDESSPLILAKCCHDLDIMYWLIGKKPLTVQSKGFLSFFSPENAPKNAPERCTDGCPQEETCPWYAPGLYLEGEPLIRIGLHAKSRFLRFFSSLILNHRNIMLFLSKFIKKLRPFLNWEEFPANFITSDLSYEGKMKALKEGPFGKCIFKTGNDVVDHQIATYTFPNGVIGTLRITGLSEFEGRELRIFGTKGVIRAHFRTVEEEIKITDFRTYKTKRVYIKGLSKGSHGGGDFNLLDSFIKVIKGDLTPEQAGTTNIQGALQSHIMAFAGEEARISGRNHEF
nr:putative oxidoreductase [Candidatus Prometheoarchaeum syntrophicum]